MKYLTVRSKFKAATAINSTILVYKNYFINPLGGNHIFSLHCYFFTHIHIGPKCTHAHTGPIDMKLLWRDVRVMGLPQSHALLKGTSAVPRRWTGLSPATSPQFVLTGPCRTWAGHRPGHASMDWVTAAPQVPTQSQKNMKWAWPVNTAFRGGGHEMC